MAEPISETEARQHLRLTPTQPAPLLAGYITAAREWVEDYTGQTLIPRQITQTLDGFSRQLALRAWPVAPDAPVKIVYRHQDGTEGVLSNAVARTATRPVRLAPAIGELWPRWAAGQIEVTVTAGYPSAEAVPQKFKQAMLILITAYHEDREGGDLLEKAEAAARRLCRKEKSWRL